MAKAYGCRPSDFLNGDYADFLFDYRVSEIGREYDDEMRDQMGL
jgi:hypothetical protein